MKAIRLHKRGGPEELVYEEAPKPTPGPDDAIVRVHACAITATELSWVETYTTSDGRERLPTIPGHELSGVVESVAPGVTGREVGDAVYGLTDFVRDGAAAEYVAVYARDLARKPANLTHVEAAAVPLSALTAWQALFEHAGLRKGQSVLIHGGAGGVGTFAVQLAHWAEARVVTTVRSTDKGLVQDLGADEIIDYTVQRFEDVVHDLDVVFDTVGGDTQDRSWKVLRPGGILVTVVTVADNDPAVTAAKYGVRGVYFVVRPSRAQLTQMRELIEAGEVHPVIQKTFPLERAPEAFSLGLKGHNRGKIVLSVADATAQERAAAPADDK